MEGWSPLEILTLIQASIKLRVIEVCGPISAKLKQASGEIIVVVFLLLRRISFHDKAC